MKIIWLSNVIVPIVSQDLNIPDTVLGGWMDGLAKQMAEDNEMVFIFPYKGGKIEKHTARLSYYGFEKCDEAFFERIIINESPDLIHIWGTEMQHSLYMAKACQKCGIIDRTVVSIQGLIHYIGEYHYFAGLPHEVVKSTTFHDFLLHNTISDQCAKFKRRGEYELEVLKTVKHVIGRTLWDHESVKLINKDLQYHRCYESLRGVFYENTWDIEKCDPLQLFMSQGHYPLKGLHMVIKALKYVSEQFPDIKLVVISKDVYKQPFYRMTAYQAYIKKLIDQNGLRDNIVFVSQMDAEMMANTYCRSRVFINASSVENSSNSIGEAMLMGCPCIASNVGGTSSFITDGVDGLLYPFNEPYSLASKILFLLSDSSACKQISMNAKERAKILFDREKNYHDVLHVYHKLVER